MLTDYTKNLITTAAIGQASTVNLGGNMYFALLSGSSAADEITGTDYSRILVGNYSDSTTWKFAAPVAGSTYNIAELNFARAGDAWGVISYGALFDAPTGGNMITIDPFTSSIDVSQYDYVTLLSGSFTIHFSV